MQDWMYDELTHVGIDYSKPESAAAYDNLISEMRDYKEDCDAFIRKLNLTNINELTAIEIGCGTGLFTVQASKYLKKILAVDVSEAMLKIAKEKVKRNELTNIEFFKSGFLQFKPDEKVDIVYSELALHHLPDYWKQAALLNINKMLKPHAIFFLSDVVFKYDPHFEKNTGQMIKEISNQFSKELVEEVKIHIKEEYSTFDWIMQGLIEKAGFQIEYQNTQNIFKSEYLCRKVKEFDE